MENSEFTKGTIKKIIYFFSFLLITLLTFMRISGTTSGASPTIDHESISQQCTWQICSIDTMKTSRDKARDNVDNPEYKNNIRNQLQLIKQTGANFVAVNTPYDEEFIPYLTQWVTLAREERLHVWFRGNWSSWEGWFNYPKDMTPDEHITKTEEFINKHADLFEDGDIFDACPECENAHFWPQPFKDQEFGQFLQKQRDSLRHSFAKINKDVRTNIASTIGGRAKDVLDQKTFDALDNLISIDHYVNDSKNMSDYIDYFSKDFHTKTLVSEFGAPIPDLNGPMDEDQQAEFIKQILESLYLKKDNVVGLNYWVLSHGTTQLVNEDGSKRAAYDVLKQYFTPSIIYGTVTNPLGDHLSEISLKTTDGANNIHTDRNGNYLFSIPPRKFTINIDDPEYSSQSANLEASESGQKIQKDFVLTPTNPGLTYIIRLQLKHLSEKLPL